MSRKWYVSAFGITETISADTRGQARMKVARILKDAGYVTSWRDAFVAIRAIVAD